MPTSGPTVVFIPGLWLHAESWRGWVELFRAAGYVPTAPGWPGMPPTVEATRAHPEGMAGHGLQAIANHYARLILTLDERPIVIGHALGGIVAQNLLTRGLASAAVALNAAPSTGVLPLTSLRGALSGLKTAVSGSGVLTLSRAEFRSSFANAISEDEANALHERWVIPGPGKPLFQAAAALLDPKWAAKVDTRTATRGPLLLTSGELDRTVPPEAVRAILRQYLRSPAVTEYQQFRKRGHSIAIDSGWREIAEFTLDWLRRHPPPATAT